MKTTLERTSLLGLTNLAGAHAIRMLAREYFHAANAGITVTGDIWVSKHGDARWVSDWELAEFHQYAIEHVAEAVRTVAHAHG
jgi:hypothetical protein